MLSAYNKGGASPRNKGKGLRGGARIKVAVRVRPMLHFENGHQTGKIQINGDNQIEVIHNANNDESQLKQMSSTNQGFNRRKVYNFDQVFTPEHSQNDVYEGLGISSLITKVVEGYHATIFAYGQTGSGKTFTMEGNEREFEDGARPADVESTGITQRGVMELFEQIEQMRQENKNQHFSVFCSFLQIYNEKVFDLLNPSSVGGLTALRKKGNGQFDTDQGGLRIRWTKKDQFVVENLYVFECSSYEETLKLFKFGS